jgi:hypothetical protein
VGIAALAAISARTARADEPADDGGEAARARPDRAANHFNLRIGGASTDGNGRPVICGEVHALARLSFEGCGTGSGFLHHAPGSEMAHFRALWQVRRWSTGRSTIAARAGVGFAELQLGPDDAGFQFGSPTGLRNAVAGPEGSGSVQLLVPMADGVEAIATATAGLAWFAGADQLITPRDHLQPFASVEVGIGW